MFPKLKNSLLIGIIIGTLVFLGKLLFSPVNVKRWEKRFSRRRRSSSKKKSIFKTAKTNLKKLSF